MKNVIRLTVLLSDTGPAPPAVPSALVSEVLMSTVLVHCTEYSCWYTAPMYYSTPPDSKNVADAFDGIAGRTRDQQQAHLAQLAGRLLRARGARGLQRRV